MCWRCWMEAVVTGPGVVDPVVVGVDGSPGSLAAVLVAAAEAALRRRPLRVVHGRDESAARAAGVAPDELLAEAIATARDAVPGLLVGGEVVAGRPADVLVHESQHAPLVVIGDRGLSRLAELVTGAMGVHLATHASCPVLVVRGDPARAGDVLLGVEDDPTPDDPAVEFAFQEAALHGVAITALHASTAAGASPERDPGEPAGDRSEFLAGVLTDWQRRYPQVAVHPLIVHDDAQDALIEASRSARLTVVGAGDRGELAGLLFGSLSLALLRHADCPLVIVRHTAPEHSGR
jgi:nucleotide-binding universal stress UspA family protein